MPTVAMDLIRGWLQGRLPDDRFSWLEQQLAAVPAMDGGDLAVALALAARKAGKAALALTPSEMEQARTIRPGWDPSGWSLDSAAQILLLLGRARAESDFGETFQRLCQSADLGQSIALYRGLPLYGPSAALDWQIGEGLRSSIAAIFEAIAHHSPLPAEHFDEHRWNHMVLKTLFIGSDLRPIVGLDGRRNAALAGILVDHVRERRAAGRPVDRQVWRCVAPYAVGRVLDLLLPLLESAVADDRRAAALCLVESPDPVAAELLSRLAPETAEMRTGKLHWAGLTP